MGFQIGSQNAGVINNVDGVQHNNYGPQDAAALIARVRAELERLPLPDDLRAAACECVDDASAELSSAEPDRPAIAERLARLTALLSGAGALAAAGASLVGPLSALAGWLGALGGPVSRLLQR